MRGFWVGAGWFVSGEHLDWVVHARGRFVFSFIFLAAIKHVLFYILFSHDLRLHAVFAEDIGTHSMFFCFCSNTAFCFDCHLIPFFFFFGLCLFICDVGCIADWF